MSFPTRTILIVSSDTGIKGKLTDYFTSFGYTINCASTSQHAIEIVNSEFPNLIIIDIILPKHDGFELCREIRTKSTIPIILLSPFQASLNVSLVLRLGQMIILQNHFLRKS